MLHSRNFVLIAFLRFSWIPDADLGLKMMYVNGGGDFQRT